MNRFFMLRIKANYIYAYDIESPGKVKNKRVFARLNDGEGP